MVRYLVQFYQDIDWKTFRLAELDALIEEALGPSGVTSEPFDPSRYYQRPEGNESPFIIVNLPSFEVAQKVCARSVLIKHVYDLWSYGPSLSAAIEAAREIAPSLPKDLFGEDRTWAVKVDTFQRTYSFEQKREFITKLKFLPFLGSVKLSNPDVSVHLLMEFARSEAPDHDMSPEVPTYVARLVASGRMREEVFKYDLKKRHYIGPTSLDHTLAIIMANVSHVKKGSIVLDPFVGTASLLVAMSHFGARCFGSDIDIRVLNGNMYAGGSRGSSDPGGADKRSIWDNFRQYGLETPELLRIDNHMFDTHYGAPFQGFFDAIVTDPPYGIRAGAKKSGRSSARGGPLEISPELRATHVPATQQYQVEEVMLDLLDMAAKALRIGGHLSYLIPTPYGFDQHDLPKHPCLRFVDMCEQGLSTRHGRNMVVMQKVRDPTPETRAEFAEYKRAIATGTDDGFGTLMSKLQKALAADAFANEEVVKNASKCALKRRESKEKRMRISQQKNTANSHSSSLDDDVAPSKAAKGEGEVVMESENTV